MFLALQVLSSKLLEVIQKEGHRGGVGMGRQQAAGSREQGTGELLCLLENWIVQFQILDCFDQCQFIPITFLSIWYRTAC